MLRGPAFRILEKQNHPMVNALTTKKIHSSERDFAVQGFLVVAFKPTPPKAKVKSFARMPLSNF
jgi:hypothetical protein